MSTAFLAAFAVQWVVIALLAVMMVGLLRQVGMLHERLGPVGALTLPGGPKVGDIAPAFDLPSLTGGQVRVGGMNEDGASTLLFFLSPTCAICKTMLPILLSMAREHGGTRLVLASDGDEERQMKLIIQEKLTDYPFVLSTDLGRAHGVAKLPYAVLLDAEGRIVAKGLVNNREHVESLFEAQRSGIASIQDYLTRRNAAS